MEYFFERKVADMCSIPVINLIKTGKNIEKLRKDAGITVRELQDVFGFRTPQAVYKWQHGDALPTVDNLIVLAYVLKVKVEDIIVVDDTL